MNEKEAAMGRLAEQQAVSPEEFDRVYVHMMVPDHRQTVELFEKYVLTGKDADVKAFAEQTLPVLKAYLAAIIAIDNSMK